MSCDFNNAAHVCPCCGMRAPGRSWQHNCPESPVATAERPPTIVARLLNFSRAAIGHALAGCPTCTQEQIDARLTICRGCEHFRAQAGNPHIGSCAKCGCSLSGYLNKLAWADQQCPLEKWPRVS